jgi:hypothetical protein
MTLLKPSLPISYIAYHYKFPDDYALLGLGYNIIYKKVKE